MIAPEGEAAEEARAALQSTKTTLEALEDQIAPLQTKREQLGRQFWVYKDQVVDNKYDLSASRYRKVMKDEIYIEEPGITLKRLLKLEMNLTKELENLMTILAQRFNE